MNEIEQEDVEQLEVEEYTEKSLRGLLTRMRIPLLIVAVLLVVGLFYWIISGITSDKIVDVEGITEEISHQPPPFGSVFFLNDIILNPAGGRGHFMVSIGLEHFSPEKVKEMQRREPLLRDNLITFFSSQPVEVLTNIRYRQAVRSRIIKIMDYQLGEGTVTRVFFRKWVFQ